MALRIYGLKFASTVLEVYFIFFSISSFCRQKCIIFDLRKYVRRHTIQINQPTRCNNFTSLLLDVYVWLNMFRAPLRPSSGAYNCTWSLWFYRWSVVVGALMIVVWQTTTINAPTTTLHQ